MLPMVLIIWGGTQDSAFLAHDVAGQEVIL